ncbi:hypothetical protein SMACR_07769 [Sordaria macrospora]|uniref:WGS project CABT00000000 data, contig 2.47 n=2 Tax=Sordaria macrospora TaxID=5147 RepID=F7W8Z0_SORMK|nr:uncharacterized protein SMAC_07769 [Sordaria macrospora k-hell]KAA8620654.1 hypothetical protein SMACR_07769 [Sordaria macrospora]WPJ66440.1 hypothetical protein SMAC4_07769 [Sordaria macrospora]CCC05113.1 unnamed protein product [Sordaria macrospora k-hell]
MLFKNTFGILATSGSVMCCGGFNTISTLLVPTNPKIMSFVTGAAIGNLALTIDISSLSNGRNGSKLAAAGEI